MEFSWSGPIMPSVSGVSGVWTVMKWERFRTSSKVVISTFYCWRRLDALAGFDEGVVGDDVHAEADGFVGDGATDAAVSEDAEGCAAGSVHRLVEGYLRPAAGFDLGVVLAEAAVEGEDHSDGVVGDFVHAVVGDVGDDDAELGSGWDVDVVDADAVSGSDHALFGGFEDVAGHLGEAEHDDVGVGCEFGEGGF